MEETEVVICGGGPTGAVLSAVLGKLQVPNIVLEREAGITTDPRGIALDEDGVRTLQSLGIYDKIFTEIGSGMKKFHFVSGRHTDFYRTPILSVDNSTSEGGTGHVGFICHKQPSMEKAIRDSVAKSPSSELRSGCQVNGIIEDDDYVTVTYQDAAGQSRSIKSRFLVGADGKTGFVRKKYLEPRGIILEKSEGWVDLFGSTIMS